MSGQLQGRVALVTGAGAGIGEGIARRFAEEGAQVVVAEFDEASGRAVAESVGGTFVACDVTVREQVEAAVGAAVAAYGSIDIVVNNAWGGGSISRVERKTDEALLRGMQVGYLGPFWAMTAALPHMKERGWGRVVNMCSLNGVNAHMGSLEYNAAKEALRALTRTAAREWAPTGVTVNAICPAAKSQAFFRAIGEYPSSRPSPTPPTRWAGWATRTPTSRRSRSSWRPRAAPTSPATRCSSTAARTSTARPWAPDLDAD